MKILQILEQTSEEVSQKKNQRTVKSLERSQKALVDSLEKEIELLEDRQEELTSAKEINPDTWAKELHEVTLELEIKQKELEIAKSTLEKYF